MSRPEVQPPVRQTCVWALHVAALRQSGRELDDLPDPYEPLLVMYERGGGFTVDGTGFIRVDIADVPQGTPADYRDRPPLFSLRHEDLDGPDG